ALEFVADPAAGATVLFIGTVRDRSPAGEVTALTYEAWEDVAQDRLHGIGEEMLDRWNICKAALLHRSGYLGVGEVSVIVCCSAPHRAEAFEASRHGIERIKKEVPIWKKESLITGDAEWVTGS
ncbi:MAG: molybdenum cofactor biosynthesis protein MoaE, partial [Actinomycetota bacterium]|nr:molybdenum cofactor biosynthesis protein MoaE [Actinomycetota bacterium]